MFPSLPAKQWFKHATAIFTRPIRVFLCVLIFWSAINLDLPKAKKCLTCHSWKDKGHFRTTRLVVIGQRVKRECFDVTFQFIVLLNVFNLKNILLVVAACKFHLFDNFSSAVWWGLCSFAKYEEYQEDWYFKGQPAQVIYHSLPRHLDFFSPGNPRSQW